MPLKLLAKFHRERAGNEKPVPEISAKQKPSAEKPFRLRDLPPEIQLQVAKTVATDVRATGSPEAIRGFLSLGAADTHSRSVIEGTGELRRLKADLGSLGDAVRLGEKVNEAASALGPFSGGNPSFNIKAGGPTFRLQSREKRSAMVRDVLGGDHDRNKIRNLRLIATDPDYMNHISSDTIRQMTDATVKLLVERKNSKVRYGGEDFVGVTRALIPHMNEAQMQQVTKLLKKESALIANEPAFVPRSAFRESDPNTPQRVVDLLEGARTMVQLGLAHRENLVRHAGEIAVHIANSRRAEVMNSQRDRNSVGRD